MVGRLDIPALLLMLIATSWGCTNIHCFGEIAFLFALEHIKHIICLLVGSFVRSTTRGQSGHLIPSVRLLMRTGFGRTAMFLILPYGLALWFANTGCWCEPDSRIRKGHLVKT